MEYCLTLNGRLFADLEIEKQQALQRITPITQADWCALGASALEVIGVRRAVSLGDSRLWRQAVTESNAAPLPPLNLPLLLWDAYQTHPFEGFTVRKRDGETVQVPDWSQFYYSWHERCCAVALPKGVQFIDPEEIVAVEFTTRSGPQIAIMERLQWLQKAEHFAPFAVRTREGHGFMVYKRNNFQLDDSLSLLVIHLNEQPPLFLRVADIVAVRLPSSPAENLKQELIARRNASPFIPFHLHLLNGACLTVKSPHELLLTNAEIIAGTGSSETQIKPDSTNVPWSWLESIEVVPPEAVTR